MTCRTATRPSRGFRVLSLLLGAACLAAICPAAIVRGGEPAGPAGLIVDRGGFPGGLCIVVGAEEAAAAVELGRGGRFLVQVLDSDAGRVTGVQSRLRGEGLYGMVTADRLPPGGRLPFAEDLVNVVLLGREAQAAVPLEEVRRVLCPRGVTLLPGDARDPLVAAGFAVETRDPRDDGWTIGQKPRPAGMGEWTHPRHGPDGNAVSDDLLVGPPRRVRWLAGPPVEISNMVSAAGRNYYGGVWARDAFNGLPLWDRLLRPSPARGNYGYSVAAGAVAPVAAGDELLVVHEEQLKALDGASGQPLRIYAEAGTPKQLLWIDGRIIVADDQSVRCLEADSTRLSWTREAAEPQYLVAGGGTVFFLEGAVRRGEKLAATALDLDSGKPRWRHDQDQEEFAWLPRVRRTVASKGLIVFEVSTLADEKSGNAVHVASADEGRILWSREFVPGMNHMKQARVMFAGDLLWVLEHLRAVGLDPRTGEVRRSHPAGECHCFPPVATSRYLFSGEMDLTDLESGEMDAHQITKAACGRDAGWVPANGLIYACPKHCVCWPMLRGYVALAPECPRGALPDDPRQIEFPVERGVVAPEIAAGASGEREAPADSWPCYRQNAWRSASTTSEVPAELQVLWTAELGGRPDDGPIARDWSENPFVRGPITAPVIAGGMVYLARPDAHEIVALDAANGTVRWRATLSGRVDTPPTIHRGLCLAGTRTGWVYCLRADDGRMVWRMRAAPRDEQIVAHGQIESPWPVAGSVLVVEETAYFAAGRQSLADGGILVFAVDPPSGAIRWVNRIDSIPDIHFRGYGLPPGELPLRKLYSCNALEFEAVDLPHREGDRVTVARWLFDLATGEKTVKAEEAFAVLGEGESAVVVPRGSWSYAPRHQPRFASSENRPRPLVAFADGALLGCLDDMRTLFRREFDAASLEGFNRTWITGWAQSTNFRKKEGEVWRSERLVREASWQVAVLGEEPSSGDLVAAMVLAADRLFVAGGEGRLEVLSAKDGRRLTARDLPAPIWDGMAAAEGRLFVSTADGRVVCLGR